MCVVGDTVHRGIDPRLFRILPALLDSGEGGFSFLSVSRGGDRKSRITDQRSIGRSIVARELIASPPLIGRRTMERWNASFLSVLPFPLEIYARGSKSNTCLDTTMSSRMRRRVGDINCDARSIGPHIVPNEFHALNTLVALINSDRMDGFS